MRVFEQITLGGIEWCVWGKDDKHAMLCSVKSVIKSNLTNQNEYGGKADFVGSKIDKFLNGKFLRKLCTSGIQYSMIVGPITIFDADTVRRMADASFVLPPIVEDRWWLKGKAIDGRDKAVSNYMLQADNHLDIHKECGVLAAGVRAVMTVNRAALTQEQDDAVKTAVCLVDKTTVVKTGRLYARSDVTKAYRREHNKAKSAAHDKIYRLRYHLVIVPLPSIREQSALITEMKDRVSNKSKICSLQDVAVESISVVTDCVYIVVSTGLNVNLNEMVDNIKAQLIPESLWGNKKRSSGLLRRLPKVWYDGFLLDTSDLSMASIEEYQSQCAGN